MGKGIGKLNAWQSRLRGNSFIFEFKNLRPGRSIKFFKKMRVKFPVPTRIVFKNLRSVQYLSQKRLNTTLRSFW
jgi:ribosomal protein L16/L10AE